MSVQKSVYLILSFILVISCTDFGKLTLESNLPKSLKEVSGIELLNESDLAWMINDSGNSPKIYWVDKKGYIQKELFINAKNNDWEDLTSDEKGNLYIGDFGNNSNKRKNLSILKLQASDLNKDSLVSVERINFYYPSQNDFPAKKNQRYFDCEAFFHFNDSLYLFTKSRVKHNFGKTDVYKIPAKKGNYSAQLIGSFTSCPEIDCWITSADISLDKRTIALLSPKSILLFSNFENDDFFNGTKKEIQFDFISQKEGVTFKNNHTFFIIDEKAHGSGGNLYTLKID